MASGELSLRVATAAILLVTGLVLLRDRRDTESGPFGGLLALSVATVSVAGVEPVARLWPLQLMSMGTPALLWIWAGAVFDDEFKPHWRDAAAWAAMPVVGGVGLAVRSPWIGTVESVLALVFILLAAWRIAGGMRDDLLERRRRIRPVMAGLAVLYSASVVLNDLLAPARPSGGSAGRLLDAAALAALALCFALIGLRAGRSLTGTPILVAHPARSPILPTPGIEPDDQDDTLLSRLLKLMEEEKVYRQEGFGLSTLVAALDVPEYRLRRLIQQRLGHRNFSSFVNGYRLNEATAALADPEQADVAILTIALDTGFHSIGPFNRAFKAHTGMTPSAYRRQAKSRNNRPFSEIGEASAENGKT